MFIVAIFYFAIPFTLMIFGEYRGDDHVEMVSRIDVASFANGWAVDRRTQFGPDFGERDESIYLVFLRLVAQLPFMP